MPLADLALRPESPASPAARSLLGELDVYLRPMYPPASGHTLTVEQLQHPDVRFFVAWLADTAVGCGGYLHLEPGVAELKRIYTRPAARGRGVGRAILDGLEAAAQVEGVTVLRLETGIYQPQALRLYERCGYRQIGPFGHYQPDPLSLFYEKVLVGATSSD